VRAGRAALLGVVLAAGTAQAQVAVEGTGRISLLPGWRYTPNAYFAQSALREGFPLEARSSGGPQLTAAFGYMATATVEVGIDLFAGFERLTLANYGELSSVSYGALLGVRAVVPLGDLHPFVGLGLGPTLVLTQPTQQERGSHERLSTGYAVDAGVTYKVAERLAVTLGARWLLARGYVRDIGGVNAGGLWAGLGATWLFAGEPSRPGAIR
jgi:opacity protein-like surface antigen